MLQRLKIKQRLTRMDQQCSLLAGKRYEKYLYFEAGKLPHNNLMSYYFDQNIQRQMLTLDINTSTRQTTSYEQIWNYFLIGR